MKVPNEQQINALKWLKERKNQKMALCLPHTINHHDEWDEHKTSFYVLERNGLAERQQEIFWSITQEGETVLLIALLLEAMASMGSEERKQVFDQLRDNYCPHCGDEQVAYGCQCTNDE